LIDMGRKKYMAIDDVMDNKNNILGPSGETAVPETLTGERVVEPFPVWRMIIWALGTVGNTLASTIAALMTYFYLPPETEQAAFPELITSKTFMGLTVIGIAGFIGALLPIIVEPGIASMSDRSKSRFGRRRIFMIVSLLPYALLAYAIFVPPVSGVSWINTAWVLTAVILFNIMRAGYGIPFGALMPELGTTNKLIMLFSTMNSLGWAVGFVIGSQVIYVIKDALYSSGASALDAFRLTIAGLAVLSALLMIAPIFVVDEKRYCSGKVSDVNMMASLKKAFTNKTFVLFTFADLTYGMGDMLFQMGLIYFVTILLNLPETMMLTLGVALIALSFCQYPLINIATRHIGKKTIYQFGLVIMVFSLFLIAAVDLMPLPPTIMVWVVIVVASIPSAITGIIPGSIGAEIVREDSVRTGNPCEATYGAASSLLRKIPAAFPPLILPSLLVLGKSVQNPLGVRLVAIVGACFMILATVILSFYNEKKIVRSLKDHGYETDLKV